MGAQYHHFDANYQLLPLFEPGRLVSGGEEEEGEVGEGGTKVGELPVREDNLVFFDQEIFYTRTAMRDANLSGEVGVCVSLPPQAFPLIAPSSSQLVPAEVGSQALASLVVAAPSTTKLSQTLLSRSHKKKPSDVENLRRDSSVL